VARFLRLRRLALERAPTLFLRFARAADRQELGRAGEALVARALRRSGWRLLGRRLRTPHGEVDVWALREGIACAFEVKTGRAILAFHAPPDQHRPGWDSGRLPGRSLDRSQVARLHRAARWLARRVGARPAVALVEVVVEGGRATLLEPQCVPEPDPRAYTRRPP